MAQVAAPLLRHWPRLISHRPSPPFTKTPTVLILHHLLSSFLTSSLPWPSFPISTAPPSLPRTIHLRSYGLRLRDSSPDELQDGYSDSDESPPEKKSRNEKKREARRAVRWGMDLANFSPSQIKRILRFSATVSDLMSQCMVGRLLRKVEPELMDLLIQASKDGDVAKLQNISGEENWTAEDEEDNAEKTEFDDGEQETPGYVEVAARWFDGLVGQDLSITNEVYSIYDVEFDRQELRKLVRRVQSIQEHQLVDEKAQEDDANLTRAKKFLTRFLRALAKQALTTK
ncbi:hypothetical protein ACLOJK_005789 [Asimina triloba]